MGSAARKQLSCGLPALGMVNALGSSLDEIWPRLRDGDQSRLVTREELVRGQALWFAPVHEQLPDIPRAMAEYDTRTNRLALAALESIQEPIRRAISRFGAHRVGVVVGSTTAGLDEAERAYEVREAGGALPPSFSLVQLEFGGVSEFVAKAAGAQGPCYAVSTACSTGGKALASARGLLRIGICDAVIAGGADSLCRLTANGFAALQAISKDPTNPMSRNRRGLTLGEGAALFLVTREPEGIQLCGVGESNDAYHMSAPDPEARGAEASMRSAIKNAAVEAEEVDYVNLHGTGTEQNDLMEAAAVERVLGNQIPCSSTKPLVGHTLGASGAIELGFCWMVLSRREGRRLMLPPHRWDGEQDSALPSLPLVSRGQHIEVQSDGILLSNSFGFGGSNCTLVVAGEQ